MDRRLVLGTLIISLLVLVWYWSPLVPSLRGRYSECWPLAFSPDGNLLAVTGIERRWHKGVWDSSLRLLDPNEGTWETVSLPRTSMVPGTDLAEVGARGTVVRGAEFSPDGRFLSVKVTDRISHIQTQEPDSGNVQAAGFWGPAGKELPLQTGSGSSGEPQISESERLLVLTMATMEWRDVSENTSAHAFGLLFSPDSRFLIWCSDDRTTYRSSTLVYDLNLGRPWLHLLNERGAICSPDSRLLGTIRIPNLMQPAGCPAQFCLRDLSSGEIRRTISLPTDESTWFSTVALAPDGRFVVLQRHCFGTTGSSRVQKESCLVVLDLDSGRLAISVPVYEAHVVGDPPHLIVSHAGALTIHDLRSHELERTSSSPFSLLRSTTSAFPDNTLQQLFLAGSTVAWQEQRQSVAPVVVEAAKLLGWQLPASRQRIGLLDVRTGSQRTTHLNSPPLHWFLVTPDCSRAAGSSDDNTYTWDLPGRRSWLPTMYTLALLTSFLLLRSLYRWWRGGDRIGVAEQPGRPA